MKGKTVMVGIIVIAGMLMATFLFNLKHQFKTDEILSFSLSNDKGFGWVVYDTNNSIFQKGEYTGFEVTDNRFDYLKVIDLQINDCHPPLYYMGIHTISSLFPNKLSPWFAFAPNLIAYLLSIILVYQIASKFLKDYKWALICSGLFAFSPVVLDGVLFLRMYALVTVFSLGITNAALGIIKRTDNRSILVHCVLLFICTLLGTLTHYYFYLIMLGVVCCSSIILIQDRKIKKLCCAAVSVASATILSWTVYPAVFKHLTSNSHALAAVENLANSNIIDRLAFYINANSIGLVGLIVIGVSVIMALKSKEKNNKLFWFSLVVPAIYFIIVSKTSTYLTQRYMIPIDGLLILALVFAIQKISITMKKSQKLWKIATILIVVVSIFAKQGLFEGLKGSNSIRFAESPS